VLRLHSADPAARSAAWRLPGRTGTARSRRA